MVVVVGDVAYLIIIVGERAFKELIHEHSEGIHITGEAVLGTITHLRGHPKR